MIKADSEAQKMKTKKEKNVQPGITEITMAQKLDLVTKKLFHFSALSTHINTLAMLDIQMCVGNSILYF